MNDSTSLMSASALSHVIGLSVRQIWKLARAGKIPCVRINSRVVRYDQNAVMQALTKLGLRTSPAPMEARIMKKEAENKMVMVKCDQRGCRNGEFDWPSSKGLCPKCKGKGVIEPVADVPVSAWQVWGYLRHKWGHGFTDELYSWFCADCKTCSYGYMGIMHLLSQPEDKALEVMRNAHLILEKSDQAVPWRKYVEQQQALDK